MKQQTIFSGIQPSGDLHIGHFFGAIKNWVELQEKYRTIFCIVDEHAITVPQDPETLRGRTLDIAAWFIAAGIDPNRSIIFVQSHNQDHTQLGWMLNTLTPLGELYRMTQFKDKAGIKPVKVTYAVTAGSGQELKEEYKGVPKLIDELEHREGVLAGLLNYPTLMAADILLYQTDAVPVGEDQKQHVELARTLARKFNSRFGTTFKEPKELIQKTGSRIMSLQDPSKKMSKSDSDKNGAILLLDSADDIRRKIKIAVTDSGKEIAYHPDTKPAIANLITIYHLFSEMPLANIEKKFLGKGYGEFKKELGELAAEKLAPIQKKYRELKKEKKQMLQMLTNGAKAAKEISGKTLADAKQKIGFL